MFHGQNKVIKTKQQQTKKPMIALVDNFLRVFFSGQMKLKLCTIFRDDPHEYSADIAAKISEMAKQASFPNQCIITDDTLHHKARVEN